MSLKQLVAAALFSITAIGTAAAAGPKVSPRLQAAHDSFVRTIMQMSTSAAKPREVSYQQFRATSRNYVKLTKHQLSRAKPGSMEHQLLSSELEHTRSLLQMSEAQYTSEQEASAKRSRVLNEVMERFRQ